VAVKNLKRVAEHIERFNINVFLGPETTGRTSQIGDLDEVIEICRALNDARENAKPTIDWAHLYARHNGKFIVSVDDVIRVVECLEKELGEYAVKPLHTHFSKIEYGRNGEIRHRALSEKEYDPQFEHICSALYETGVDAIIISESPLLELDALKMKKICLDVCGSKCVSD